LSPTPAVLKRSTSRTWRIVVLSPGQRLADGADDARVVEAAQRIGAGVKLDVDPAHLMLCRPLERLFEPEPAPDVNPDPITQTHQVAPLTAAR